jgi:hypothetical protein
MLPQGAAFPQALQGHVAGKTASDNVERILVGIDGNLLVGFVRHVAGVHSEPTWLGIGGDPFNW